MPEIHLTEYPKGDICSSKRQKMQSKKRGWALCALVGCSALHVGLLPLLWWCLQKERQGNKRSTCCSTITNQHRLITFSDEQSQIEGPSDSLQIVCIYIKWKCHMISCHCYKMFCQVVYSAGNPNSGGTNIGRGNQGRGTCSIMSIGQHLPCLILYYIVGRK